MWVWWSNSVRVGEREERDGVLGVSPSQGVRKGMEEAVSVEGENVVMGRRACMPEEPGRGRCRGEKGSRVVFCLNVVCVLGRRCGR